MRNKRTIWIIAIMMFLAFVIFSIRVKADNSLSEQERKTFLKEFLPEIDETLKAYNEEDYHGFYKYYAKRRLAKTEAIFIATWVDGYKRQYGNLVSKTFIQDKSNFNEVNPLLYYRAEFQKTENAEIKVIFVKEKGAYKIFHIRFDPTGKDYDEYWKNRLGKMQE